MSLTSVMKNYSRLPGDLLIEIALFLEDRQDVLNLCLTSTHVFLNVSSVLYRTVVLRSALQCQITLGMLLRERWWCVARHVRGLVVRLGRLPVTPRAVEEGVNEDSSSRGGGGVVDNEIASVAVRNTAGAKVLDALVRFEWDDEEFPVCDDMWFALRIGCPQLRYISTSLGSMLPLQNSHFFDFRNLTRLSTKLTSGFYNHNLDMLLEHQNIPVCKQLRDLLICRCPNLEELVFDGTSNVPAVVPFIIDGRWPKLRKLSLGDVCFDLFPAIGTGEKRPFVTFLEEHPDLESLCLSRHNVQAHYLGTLSPMALGRLECFSGTVYQLQAIPQVYEQLSSVAFCEAVELGDVSLLSVMGLLRKFVSLVELKICFALHSVYDSGNLLGSLVQSCPRLRHLELTCGHKPSFQLDTFAKAIRDLPRLKTLDLSIVKYPDDETISSGAARIARSNPRLRNFKLTLTSPTAVQRLPLAFSVPYQALHLPFAYPSRCTGTYELTCDEYGLPCWLNGVERRCYEWPWGVFTRTKRVRLGLRPKSFYVRTRRRLLLLSLAFEQSGAGEEMRLILFCSFLVLLAFCGVWVNAAVVG